MNDALVLSVLLKTRFEEAESVRLTQDFLKDRDHFLHYLLR